MIARRVLGCCWRTALVGFLGVFPYMASAETIVIEPVVDNTLYEDASGALSNGSGPHLFAGLSNMGLERRGVLAFDIASAIPAGSTISTVSLQLNMSRTSGGVATISLHPLLNTWGEGASVAPGSGGSGAPAEAGDATWLHRFYDDSLWATPGGDHRVAPDGIAFVDGEGLYTWNSTPEMVDTAQSWLDSPAQAYGWLLISKGPAKRFDSREFTDQTLRPSLRVGFVPPLPPPQVVPSLGAAALLCLILGMTLITHRQFFTVGRRTGRC
ncbi:MAG: hypothetical protein DHS20C11_13980 [Lysobacteraceae bacterium]|nr:MAG: hypothetical protein DHS20C11_13980 [Xanthomonadaceae bacterium]